MFQPAVIVPIAWSLQLPKSAGKGTSRTHAAAWQTTGRGREKKAIAWINVALGKLGADAKVFFGEHIYRSSSP
jgi:hypothetical protein